MKKKLFPKIIYYLFTFSLGLLLAFTLPYYFMYYDVPLNDMEEYLSKGVPDKAMELVGGYFNRTPAFSQSFDDGSGLVLFEAATLVYNSGAEGDKTVDESKLHISYAGFIYGIKGVYDVGGENNNKTKLSVTSEDGTVKNVALLDYDIDSNGVKENIGTLMNNGFIYLDIDKDTFQSLSTLTFIDRNGLTFRQFELSLDYSETFFADVDDFLQEYNRDYKSDKLSGLYDEFIAKNSDYAMSSYGDIQKRADAKATWCIVAYFVAIYIIGDFLVGRNFILRFFRWIYSKTPRGKAKAKEKAQVSREAFGHDYYSQVTVSLDLSEIPDFCDSVQLRYSNTDVEIAFILLKQNGYCATERVKAGQYVNGRIDLNREYAPVDMPENLIVEGYKMDVKIKIIKRKEESV